MSGVDQRQILEDLKKILEKHQS